MNCGAVTVPFLCLSKSRKKDLTKTPRVRTTSAHAAMMASKPSASFESNCNVHDTEHKPRNGVKATVQGDESGRTIQRTSSTQ